jgi:hypothetical protein
MVAATDELFAARGEGLRMVGKWKKGEVEGEYEFGDAKGKFKLEPDDDGGLKGTLDGKREEWRFEAAWVQTGANEEADDDVRFDSTADAWRWARGEG